MTELAAHYEQEIKPLYLKNTLNNRQILFLYRDKLKELFNSNDFKYLGHSFQFGNRDTNHLNLATLLRFHLEYLAGEFTLIWNKPDDEYYFGFSDDDMWQADNFEQIKAHLRSIIEADPLLKARAAKELTREDNPDFRHIGFFENFDYYSLEKKLEDLGLVYLENSNEWLFESFLGDLKFKVIQWHDFQNLVWNGKLVFEIYSEEDAKNLDFLFEFLRRGPKNHMLNQFMIEHKNDWESISLFYRHRILIDNADKSIKVNIATDSEVLAIQIGNQNFVARTDQEIENLIRNQGEFSDFEPFGLFESILNFRDFIARNS